MSFSGAKVVWIGGFVLLGPVVIPLFFGWLMASLAGLVLVAVGAMVIGMLGLLSDDEDV